MDIIMVKYDVQNSDEQAELALITPSNGTKPLSVFGENSKIVTLCRRCGIYLTSRIKHKAYVESDHVFDPAEVDNLIYNPNLLKNFNTTV